MDITAGGNTVLRHIPDFLFPFPAGRSRGYVLALIGYRTAFRSSQTEDCLNQLALSGSGHTGNSEDFSFPDRERNMLHFLGAVASECSQIVNFQDRFGNFLFLLGCVEKYLPANHQVGKPMLVRLMRRQISCHNAVFQNSNIIRDFHDFFELMSNQDDGFPLFGQISDCLKQSLNSLRCQYGSGFVQDNNLRSLI